MIIAFRPRYPLDQLLFYLQLGLLGLLIISVFILGGKLFYKEKFELETMQKEELQQVFDKILTGPLALKENQRSPLALALEQKLIFLSQSLRPDLKQEEKSFRIGVKGSDAECIVKEGQPIFCTMKQYSSGGIEELEFSEKGDMKLIPHVMDKKSLLLKVAAKDGKDMEIILKASAKNLKDQKDFSAKTLQTAKWLGPDLFFRDYGGPEYQKLAQKQQIEMTQGKSRYVLYIGNKDFLTFHNGKWFVLDTLEKAQKEDPLAEVVGVSASEIEIEAWDGEGFPVFSGALCPSKTSPSKFVPELIFQDAKQRTSRQISCKIGKKRVVLQQGDWLIKTQSGWHKLFSLEEIEAFLNHEMRGELCVIDRIDPKGMVKGKYYNELRTISQPFSFRAASSKGKKGKKE